MLINKVEDTEPYDSSGDMIHKILTEIIIKEMRIPRSKRKRIYQLQYKLKCEKMKCNTIILGLKIYNLLPDEIKLLNTKTFKKKIKEIWIN